MVVAKVTKATAPNITNTAYTTGTSSPGNGYSLPEIREGTNSAAGYNLDENSREIGGRPTTLAGLQPSLRHDNTNQWTADTAPPTHTLNDQEGTSKGKRTKATLRIASLNMRGRGTEKWQYINQLLRDKRIGILALQEAHLLDCHVEHLHGLYPKRLHIIPSPNAPNTKGIALVLNKEITTTTNLSTYNVHPGRALLLETNWHANQKLTILVVYPQ
jgi:hypothetical protein